ncbi:MAG: hypothetical protein ABI589_11225, partial [Burkholderiales bacterium]
YLCTISWKMSNNMSPHGPAGSTTQPNCKIGGDKTAVQRKLTGDNATFQSLFGNPTPLYFTNGDNLSGTVLAGSLRNGAQGWQSATPYNILRLTNYDTTYPPAEVLLARQAIVLRANAIANPGDEYPVQADVVVAMFNAAVAGVLYTGSSSLGSFTWEPDQVKAYFDSLYNSA